MGANLYDPTIITKHDPKIPKIDGGSFTNYVDSKGGGGFVKCQLYLISPIK